MTALKAQWAVYGGIMPGQDMAEYTMAWSYTSEDFEADGHVRGLRYHEKSALAHDYVRALEAGGLNHARLEYLWL
jgi:hypothetical protein